MPNILRQIATAFRRTWHNPAKPLQSDDWDDVFGSDSASASGVTVNHRTALTYDAIFRGVNLISSDVGKLPCHVYKRLRNGGRVRDTDHEAYRFLRWKAGPDTHAVEFKRTLQAHALMLGNGYALIERNGSGRLLGLHILDPQQTTCVRENGRKWYVVSVDGLFDRRVHPQDILHISGLGYDGLTGYSIVELAKDSIGLGLAAERFGARYFRNSARPDIVIEYPNRLTPEAAKKLRESWERMLSGVENAHKLLVTWEGAKVVPLPKSARDAQLVQLRAHELTSAANWMGLPLHKVGGVGGRSFASLEQENAAYLSETLDGWLVAWEQKLTDKLLTEEEKAADSHFIEFERAALIRTDLKTTIDAIVSEVNNGLMTPNEARAILNNPSGGPEGDKFRRPANIVIDQRSRNGSRNVRRDNGCE